MCFFLKYIVTLFYKKLRIKIVGCLLGESGSRSVGNVSSVTNCNQKTDYILYILSYMYYVRKLCIVVFNKIMTSCRSDKVKN